MDQIREDLISHARKFKMNPDVSGAAMEEFLKLGSGMNMQVFLKGSCGCSVRKKKRLKESKLGGRNPPGDCCRNPGER